MQEQIPPCATKHKLNRKSRTTINASSYCLCLQARLTLIDVIVIRIGGRSCVCASTAVRLERHLRIEKPHGVGCALVEEVFWHLQILSIIFLQVFYPLHFLRWTTDLINGKHDVHGTFSNLKAFVRWPATQSDDLLQSQLLYCLKECLGKC